MNKFFTSLLAIVLSGSALYSQGIEFIENRGQWDPKVKFMGKVAAGVFYVHEDGFTVVQHDTADWAKLTQRGHGHDASSGTASAKYKRDDGAVTLRSHAYRVSFAGGNTKAEIIADKPLPTYNNYFIGSDPSKWASNVRIYSGITVKNIYPNIDIRYYSGAGNVKYDLIVHPGGDPYRIALKYDGADGIEVKNKELRIKTSVGELKELNPYTYQYNQTGKASITAKYAVTDNVVRFNIGAFDNKTTLVIDPALVFCSFSGSTGENWGFTATYGPDGTMYGGGINLASGFPVSGGAFQTNFAGGPFGDISIIKLSADGSTRLYATYIGGSGNDQPHSLVVDPDGNLVIAGRTNSPINNSSGGVPYPLQGGVRLRGAGGGYDIVVTKLNATGTALIGSARIGGGGDDGVNISPTRTSLSSLQQNYGDDGRSEVILDGAGNIYVASCTQSTTSTNTFPTTNAFQSTAGADQDGVVLKFDASLNTVLFSSFLGGNGNDAAYVLALNPTNGNLYVAGGTASDNLPGATAGTIGDRNQGSIDGFVSIVNPNGGIISRTTYLGTTAIDQIYGIQFDANGFPYVMGQTRGTWQIINATWNQPNGKQFIAKLRPDLSAYVYATTFGKGQAAPDISPTAFLVDRCENVYVSGWGGKLSGYDNSSAGVDGLPVTPDALKSSPDINTTTRVGHDFYFFVLERNAVRQLYGSFFGQNAPSSFGDHVDGGTSRFDKDGVIYQAMCAGCQTNAPFPTTPGAWATNKPGSQCNLAVFKIAFNLAGIQGNVRPSINGQPRDTSGCVPLTVDFTDTVQEALSYEWDFGDGSPRIFTTLPDTSHTYLNVGTYRVLLVAIDSTKCIPRDSSYTTIKVGDNQALPDFNPVKLSPPCEIFRYRFDNTSVPPPSIPFKPQTFTWDFGDGTPRVRAGSESVFHTYAAAGSYAVKLYLSDTAYCNSPDSIVKTVRVAANVRAVFATPSTGCAPYDAVLRNESVGGAQFTWDFGDGTSTTTNTGSPVSHLYTLPGIYTVTLTAVDSNTCNLIDSSRFNITISGQPTADFSAAPQPPQVNAPITFTNLSSADANRFKWVWGDGDSLETRSRAPQQYEFNLTQTYTTCLTAYTQQGCADTICRPVSMVIDPAVDVPTAFTPQSGNENSRVFVRGFGIARMKFTIYARWGEKVFETAERKIGWDGRYKGQLLPMDAYAYTLDVELVDGRKVRKTGDITLIR